MIPIKWHADGDNEIFLAEIRLKAHGKKNIAENSSELTAIELVKYIESITNGYIYNIVYNIKDRLNGVINFIGSDKFHHTSSSEEILTPQPRIKFDNFLSYLAEKKSNLVRTEDAHVAYIEFTELPEYFGKVSLTISLSEINLESGSIFAVIKFGAEKIALPIVLSLIPTQPISEDFYAESHQYYIMRHNVMHVVSDSSCHTYFNSKKNIDAFLSISEKELMSKHKINTPEEKQRVCSLQILLYLNGENPGFIDGIEGNYTKKAMSLFADKNKVSVETPPFFQALLRIQNLKI